MAVRGNGTILSSTDGQVWTSPSKYRYGTAQHRIAVGNGMVVGIGSHAGMWAWLDDEEATADRSFAALDLTFGGGRFVAVRYDRVFTSETGSNWTTDSLPAPAGAVAFSAGRFVAVGWPGDQGLLPIMTSVDGRQWALETVALPSAPQASPSAGIWLHRLVPFADGFVASSFPTSDGSVGCLSVRREGAQWRAEWSPSAVDLVDLAADGGGLVAVSLDGALYHSNDGRRWSLVSVGGILDVLSTDEGYFAAGSRGLLRSLDGADWTLASTFGQEAWSSRTLTYGEGTLVNAGASCGWGCNVTLEISTNATDWMIPQTRPPWLGRRAALASGSGVFVAIDKGSSTEGRDLYTSANGLDWVHRARLPQAQFVQDVAYGNGQFVAVGSVVVTSPDGLHWTMDSLPVPADTAGYWRPVAFGAGQFAVLSGQGWLFTSPDAVNWTLRGQVALEEYIHDLAVGPGVFAVVMEGWPTSAVLLSPDGVNWRRHILPGGQVANAVTFANGRIYVGAGSGGGWFPAGPGAIFRSTPIIHLSPPRFIAPDSWGFTLSGEPGKTYAIEVSSDLVAWEPLGQVTLVGATAEVVDPGAARASHRYYRARGIRP